MRSLLARVVVAAAIMLTFIRSSCPEDPIPPGPDYSTPIGVPATPPPPALPPCGEFKLLNRVDFPDSSMFRMSFQFLTCDGDTVDGIDKDDLTLFDNGRELSPTENKWRIVNDTALFRIYAVLVLDFSKSIVDNNALQPMKQSAQDYVSNVLGNSRLRNGALSMAVYGFCGTPTLTPIVGDFTSDASAINRAIADYDCVATGLCECSTTDLNCSIIRGLEVLDLAQAKARADAAGAPFHSAGFLTLFTDGSDRANTVACRGYQTHINATTNHVFAVALGTELEQQTLQNIGSAGYARADSTANLRAKFQEIADKVVRLATSYFTIDFCATGRAFDGRMQIKHKRRDVTFVEPYDGQIFINGKCPIK